MKVRGRRTYLYGAVDARGKTIIFSEVPMRDIAAAKRSFASKVAAIKVRSCQYLNQNR